MADNIFGDVTINGKSYRILLNSYRERDLSDFAPRGQVGGGSIAYSELLLYQPLLVTDFRHGYGFHWFTDALGYQVTNGFVDTRHAGIVTLSSNWNTTYLNLPPIGSVRGFVSFNNLMYAYTNFGLYRIGPSPSITQIYAGDILSAYATRDYLFFSPRGARIKKMSTSGTITDAGIGPNSKNYLWMSVCNGLVYAGSYDKNYVHYATKEDLSDLEGDDDNDPDVIYIGHKGSFPTKNAIAFGTDLVVTRQDGLWVIGQDNRARNVLDFSSESNPDNFNVLETFNGFLYFNVGNRLYQWSGSRINDVTPPTFKDEFPFYGITKFADAKTFDGYLNVLAYYQTEVSAIRFGLFSFDGVGWHKIADWPITTGTVLDAKLQPHAIEDVCYVFANHVAYQDGYGYVRAGIYRIPLENNIYARPPYPTTTSAISNELITSRMDMGFRMIKKITPSIRVEAQIPYPHGKISVYYSVDDGPWYKWGDIVTSGATEFLANNRIEVIENPPQPTIEYRQLRLKFVFETTDPNQTPVLEGYVVRFLLRPDMFRGWSFDIVAASSYEYGDVVVYKTPAQILSEIEALRNSKQPFEFVDIFGRKFYAFISSFVCQAMERHDIQEDGYPNIESLITVNIVEAR